MSVVRDWLLARRRSFRHDAIACIAHLKPSPQVLGEDIPSRGPCVITFNHYYRPGFNAIWMALAIASIVPHEIHFVMTGELTYPGRWYAPLGMALSKIILKRAAHIYGFTTMPPMPPRPKDVAARASAVRHVLEIVRNDAEIILGLAPEGGDNPAGVLSMPPPGFGRFALLLAAAGLNFVPVGIYEEQGKLCLHFGAAYTLTLSGHLSPDEKDALAARIVMSHIAHLLPEKLRGDIQ